jgi:hypothetical protein
MARRTELGTDGGAALPRPGQSDLVVVRNGTTYLFDYKTGKQTTTLGGWVVKGAWSADGNSLVGLTEGSGLVVYDVPGEQLLGTIGRGPKPIYEIAWNRKHELLHSVSHLGKQHSLVSTWDATGKMTHSVSPQEAEWANFEPMYDGRLLVESGYQFAIYDPDHEFSSSPTAIPTRNGVFVQEFAANPRSDWLLVRYEGSSEQGHHTSEVYLGRLGETRFDLIPAPPDHFAEELVWNSSGDRFVVRWIGRVDQKILLELWEPSKPARLLSKTYHRAYVRFSPDDRQMLWGWYSDYALARTSDMDVRHKFQVLPSRDYLRNSQPWSPDGQATAIIGHRGDVDTVELVEPESGYARQALALHVVSDTAWNLRTGLLIASSEGGLLRCWRADAKTAHPRWTAVQLSLEEFATFSPGGDLLHASTNAARQFVVMTESDDGVLTHETLNTFRAIISSSP